MRRLRPSLFFTLIAVMGGVPVWSASATSRTAPASEVGQPFPGFSLPNVAGALVRSEDLPPVVLVNIWASWCAPCLAELPALDALDRRWDGGAVVAVSVDRNEGPMVGVARRLDLQLPVLWDHDGAWVRELDPPALPMSYLVVGGRIARVHAGAMDAGALDAFVSDVGR